jgi:hypothetical protein
MYSIINPNGQVDVSSIISIFLAIISIIISIVTLYVAHIRGPQTKLIMNGKYVNTILLRRNSDSICIETHLVISNVGIRSGILYNFSLLPEHENNPRITIDPPTGTQLPRPIQPGESYNPKITIEFPKEQLRNLMKTTKITYVGVNYVTNGGIRNRIGHIERVFIDLNQFNSALAQ